VVSIGTIYKDDVMITLTSPHTVNFEDPNHYVSFGTGFNEVGTYYIVLDYTYAKSRPAPQASIKILKPSQIPSASVGTSLFFLKVVDVIFTGTEFRIDSYADYDAALPATKRDYTSLYFGVETYKPAYVDARDRGRVVYESITDKFWYGYATGWVEAGTGGSGGSVLVPELINTDTTAVWVGCIAYVDNYDTARPALATSVTTRADMGIISTGVGTTGGTIVGTLTAVRVETDISIAIGDVLYLSASEAGYVTNVKPESLIQDVGRAITPGDDTTPIQMLFIPRAMLSTSLKGTIETGDWQASMGTYKYDVDITALDSTGYAIVTSFFANNAGSMELIQPTSVELIDSFSTGLYDTARIWMTVNTKNVLYNFSSGIGTAGGGGGGGEGGITNHALLSSLSYAFSGHIGFADDDHDNANHSLDFITATAVTYFNMNANGDAGDAAGQLAIGDHTHIFGDTHNYDDIPSGSTILFESNTVILGYTLLISVDDGIIYITKGSVAGGETGGTAKTGGTWTQPNHLHTITTQAVHTHDTDDHTLTISEMPAHTHVDETEGDVLHGTGTPIAVDLSIYDPNGITESTGGGNAHNHGATDTGGSHDHGGDVGNSATVNTWRPTGLNYTRQQRI
jgi:hypothetical protein